MEKERPMDLDILRKVKESSIIIVTGSYDKIELVLELINVPFILIQPYEVSQIELRADQILIINCPGNVNDDALPKIKEFVKEGDFSLLQIGLYKIFLKKYFLVI